MELKGEYLIERLQGLQKKFCLSRASKSNDQFKKHLQHAEHSPHRRLAQRERLRCASESTLGDFTAFRSRLQRDSLLFKKDKA
jgi:hypothetical protein